MLAARFFPMRSHSLQQLSRLSRDKSFLFRASLGIMAAACAIGWLVSVLVPPQGVPALLSAAGFDSAGVAEVVNREQELDTEQTAHWIRHADQIMLMMAMHQIQTLPQSEAGGKATAPDLKSPLAMLEDLIAGAKNVDESGRMLLLNLARGLHADEAGAEEATANLRQSAAMEPPVRFANEFYADVLLKSNPEEDREVLKHYQREAAAFDDAKFARQQVVRLMLMNHDREGLQEISADPRYMQSLDAHTQLQLAAEGRDWFGLARAVLVFDYERSSLGRYLLTLLVGAVWVGIVGQFAGFGKRRFILYGAALLLGIMSASATLFVVVIQENIRGFTMGGDMWNQLVYCIAGIGLREETIKLVFFAPLVPFVLRRPEIEGLVVAAFVGLGFALQENVGYYLGRDFSPWSRFFTANFFHLAITGILGLTLVQFVRWPRTRWEELLATFLAVVVVHGVYDAFLMIPELIGEFSIFVLLILALIAYRFFDQAEHLAHPDRSRVISPLGVFVLGAALLGGVVMISSCWGMSFRSALVDFLGSGLGVFPVVFVFINRFRDA